MLGRHVQVNQHPAGLLVAIAVQVQDDQARAGAHDRPEAEATTQAFESTQPEVLEPGAKSRAA